MDNPALDLTFAHNFGCEILSEYPGTGGPRHYFPQNQRGGQDGVCVRVHPQASASWDGLFAFGTFGSGVITRVMTMPDPNLLCVIARGAGYLAQAAAPEKSEEIKATPIIDARAVPDLGIALFACHTKLVAYSGDGMAWQTKRLSWSGLKIVGIDHGTLLGEYWDIRSEAIQQFEVELRTGASRGGAEF
jgi:hypothetical protein